MVKFDFEQADFKVEVLENQDTLCTRACTAAMISYPPTEKSKTDYLNNNFDILFRNQQHIHDPNFAGFVRNYATELSSTGQHQAALEWGKAAYLLSRRFASCWLEFLGILVRANLFSREISNTSHLRNLSIYPTVPNKIMQFWDRQVPPSDVSRLMESWRTKNPDWEYIHVTDAEAQEFIKNKFGQIVYDAYKSTSHITSKSDLLRYCWIYYFGGVYVDADEECTGRLHDFISESSNFTLTWSSGPPPCINNWFIASEPGNIFLLEAIKLSVSQITNPVRMTHKINAWVLTGPAVLTMTLLDNFSIGQNYSSIQGLDLVNESDYRKFSRSVEDLEYRNEPKGNWRMEHV